jgi:hypothetical protein
MGMDVYACNPTDPENDYFRANVWGWRPIHEFMGNACSHIYGEALDRSMSFNDGQGIPANQVEECADAMQKDLDSLKDNYPEFIETVDYEDGTVELFVPFDDEWKDHYKISLSRLQEWIDFVRNSGGFQVC